MAFYEYYRIYVTANNYVSGTSQSGEVPAVVINRVEMYEDEAKEANGEVWSGPDSDVIFSTEHDYYPEYGAGLAVNAFTDDEYDSWESGYLAPLPQWIGYYAGTDIEIIKIRADENDYQFAPKDFEIQGSDDESTWVTMRSFTGVTWTSLEEKTFYTQAPPPISSFTLKHEVVPKTGTPSFTLKHAAFPLGESAFTLKHEVVAKTGAAILPLMHKLIRVGQSSLTLKHSVQQSSPGDRWRLAVAVDSNDVSDNLTGQVDIEMNGGAARVASFSMLNAGAIDSQEWVKKSVTIDYETLTGGVVQTSDRRFTGIIDDASYDPVTKLTHFNCTDDLQSSFESLSFSEIDAIVGGLHSDALFVETSNGWDYAQQRLESRPGYYDKDHYGAGRYYDWAASSVDVTYSDGDVVYDSIVLTQSTSRDIINQVDIDFTYRYNRTWQREIDFIWQYGKTFNDYRQESSTLPTRDMIMSAVGSSWIVKNIVFTKLPPTGDYSLNGSPVTWIIDEEDRNRLVFSASGTVSKRWTQDITESYQVTVKSPASIALFGASKSSETFVFDTPESSVDETVSDSSALSSYEGNTASQYSSPDYVAPDESAVTIGSDYYIDSSNRADFDNAIKTAVQLAKVDILRSHHRNEVSFSVLLDPRLDLGKTVRLNHSDIDVTGTVSSIIESFNFNRGQALSAATLSCYQPDIDDQTDATIAAPAKPANPLTEIYHSIFLPTYLGGGDQTVPASSDWRGYIGNLVRPFHATYAEFYPTEFRMEIPAIEDDRRDDLSLTTTAVFDIAIPQENLTIN